VRVLANICIGDCEFSCDPIPGIVLGHPPDVTPIMQPLRNAASRPEKPSLKEAERLCRNGLWAAGLVVDLFDEEDMIQGLPLWLESTDSTHNPLDEVYHLLIALGL